MVPGVWAGRFYHSKPRLLLPVLLTLLPAVIARPRPTRVADAWRSAGLGGVRVWYGAYLVAVWPYTL
jgi:hypothetical protein